MKVDTFFVYLLAGAKQDLLGLHRYVAENESIARADTLLDELQRTCPKLKTMPERGRIPPELERMGVFEFRERILKPYRVIYRTAQREVFVYCILDGRRDLGDLLEERLLR